MLFFSHRVFFAGSENQTVLVVHGRGIAGKLFSNSTTVSFTGLDKTNPDNINISALGVGFPRRYASTGGVLKGRVPLVCGGIPPKVNKNKPVNLKTVRKECLVPGLAKAPVKMKTARIHASSYVDSSQLLLK